MAEPNDRFWVWPLRSLWTREDVDLDASLVGVVGRCVMGSVVVGGAAGWVESDASVVVVEPGVLAVGVIEVPGRAPVVAPPEALVGGVGGAGPEVESILHQEQRVVGPEAQVGAEGAAFERVEVLEGGGGDRVEQVVVACAEDQRSGEPPSANLVVLQESEVGLTTAEDLGRCVEDEFAVACA